MMLGKKTMISTGVRFDALAEEFHSPADLSRFLDEEKKFPLDHGRIIVAGGGVRGPDIVGQECGRVGGFLDEFKELCVFHGDFSVIPAAVIDSAFSDMDGPRLGDLARQMVSGRVIHQSDIGEV
jgi:hypothetical protein